MNSPNPSPLLVQRAQMRWKSALHLLLEARHQTKDPFVPRQKLAGLGLTNVDFQEMITHGVVVCAIPGDSCNPPGSVEFVHNVEAAPDCRFLLTGDVGHQLAQTCCSGIGELPTPEVSPSRTGNVPADPVVEKLQPIWRASEHALYVGPWLIEEFDATAPAQEELLTFFAEKNWPKSLENPFVDGEGVPDIERLRNTVRNLCKRLKNKGLRFSVRRSAQEARWKINKAELDSNPKPTQSQPKADH